MLSTFKKTCVCAICIMYIIHQSSILSFCVAVNQGQHFTTFLIMSVNSVVRVAMRPAALRKKGECLPTRGNCVVPTRRGDATACTLAQPPWDTPGGVCHILLPLLFSEACNYLLVLDLAISHSLCHHRKGNVFTLSLYIWYILKEMCIYVFLAPAERFFFIV